MLLAVPTTQQQTTSSSSSLTSAFLVRVKSKIDSLSMTTDYSTILINTDDSSTKLESIPFITEPNYLLYSSSTLKMNPSSSNATLLAVILICSFSGFLFLALIFTFLLRYNK
jgi:hypothetical protein